MKAHVAADDSGPGDPSALLGFLAAEHPLATIVPVVVEGDGWEVRCPMVLHPIGDGSSVARTADYGGPWLSGTDRLSDQAWGQVRTAIDDVLVAQGAVSEVSLLGPWLPDRAAVARAWGATVAKPVVLADTTALDERWRTLSKGRRSDVTRARRDLIPTWRRFGHDDVAWFAQAYQAAMEALGAEARWLRSAEHLARLAALPEGQLWLSVAQDEHGGAAGLFLRRGTFAMYLYACRWGTGSGAGSLVVWDALEHLAALGVTSVNLGGGATDDATDPLLSFKDSLGSGRIDLHLAARVWDEAAHQEAVRAGTARPLPREVIRP